MKHMMRIRLCSDAISTVELQRSITGRPGGVLGYPRAWYRSVSCVRAPPSAYSYKFVAIFSCAQIDWQKARERELLVATLDENRRAVGLKARTGGTKGRDL